MGAAPSENEWSVAGSRRNRALAFIRDHFARYGQPPSQREIAYALKIDRSGVRDALRSLAASGLILRSPGPRGIALPETRDEALRVLSGLGWRVVGIEQATLISPAFFARGVLDYFPANRTGAADD